MHSLFCVKKGRYSDAETSTPIVKIRTQTANMRVYPKVSGLATRRENCK